MRTAGTFTVEARGKINQRRKAPHFNHRVRMGVFLTSVAFLTACSSDGKPNFFAGLANSGLANNGASDSAQVQSETSTKIVERDVEAPGVFQVSAEGLWDGRPSLGGVWVAHSDVTDPERVIIRNSANGKFVIGALFKRERSAPGPDIQVSSDAAEALGMLAGSPSALNVTALRREEVAEVAPAPQVDALNAPETIEATPLDPIADAAATLDAMEAPSEPISTAVAAAESPKPSVKPAASSLSKPYIQIGIFSVKSNAERTVSMLASQGVVAITKQGETSGKAFWRVLAGPAGTSGERTELLEKVKKSGFTDAYFVTH